MNAADNGAAVSNSEKPNVDWNQWGGSPQRNNTPVGQNIPTEWEIGEFDYRTGEWDLEYCEECQMGLPPRIADVRQPRRLRRQDLRRHQQRRQLAQALPGHRPRGHRSGLPVGLRHQGRQVSLAAQQREAADRPRSRLAGAGHLQRRARRRRSGVVCDQSRRSPLRRYRRLSRRRKRRRSQE